MGLDDEEWKLDSKLAMFSAEGEKYWKYLRILTSDEDVLSRYNDKLTPLMKRSLTGK
ncbi:hypothetical protein HCH_00014 [Hahella chejuensis KCTC 2396]|uniref:Uncharacterized protein n=1 Tax=Hahella chejuensis (strain KCTC 2396) TaxID=349521 RepID=Q2SQY7_HAHCH|nr:hypothetical protein [Hahella chejuensis]ABC26937.1 hypothetical protein HCH_00014 [Hahella chejuensis KCTC 2396]